MIFALSRYGGLRCPSEHRKLKWTDVDWEKNRFLVHSPKTEHHEGKAERWVPIFPELRPFLEEAFDLAEEGAVYVIGHHARGGRMHSELTRIVKAAGLTPWPKLTNNLRASRETELAAEYPIHVVCAWIGNSPAIAVKHYLQVTEGDFEKAAGDGSALQKAQQYGQEPTSTDSQGGRKTPGICDSVPVGASVRDTVQSAEAVIVGVDSIR